MLGRFPNYYKFSRITYFFNRGAIDDLVRFFDLTLAQNVDTLYKVTKHRKKMVVRMGGIRTFNTKTEFDDKLKEVGAIIATNDELYQIGVNNNKNTHLIPNGIDLEKFKPREEGHLPFDGGKRHFTVGFAGNVHGKMCMNYKGYKFFVGATQTLFTEIKVIKYLFGHNHIPHDEMPEKFYHQIDCLVLPSLGEGCSNVVVEALACGVPVLLTRVGYHGDNLVDGINCLFIKRDIRDIVDKIRTLIYNEDLRRLISYRGRKFAEGHHNIDFIAKKYRTIFENVMRNKE